MPVTVKSDHLDEMSRNIVNYVDAVIKREAFKMEGDMKKSMQGAKHGQVYYRHGRPHQASAPGEPPARWTGNLANSIHTVTDAQPHTALVMIDSEYAAYLEYGTVKMQPRPFVMPAVEKCRVRLGKIRVPRTVLVSGPGSL